jgi:hypothetical protein
MRFSVVSRGSINNERQHLLLWASLLKERTASKRERAAAW